MINPAPKTERRVAAPVVAQCESTLLPRATELSSRGGPVPIRCDDLLDALHVVRWRRTAAVLIEDLERVMGGAEDARNLQHLSRCAPILIGHDIERVVEQWWHFVGPGRPCQLPPEPAGWSGEMFRLGALTVRRDRGVAWSRGQRTEPTPAIWRVLLNLCDAWPDRFPADRDDIGQFRALLARDVFVNDYGAGYRIAAVAQALRVQRRRGERRKGRG